MGAHPEKGGVVFRTYAPSADKVCIIGEFNSWTEEEMKQPERSQAMWKTCWLNSIRRERNWPSNTWNIWSPPVNTRLKITGNRDACL